MRLQVAAKLLFFGITFFLFLIVPAKVLAADEFASSYDVLYDVDESGVTTVTEKISLKNLTSEYYANQFKLTIGATDLFDVKASDPGGALEISQEQKDTATSISVKFNQQVAGLGKILSWTISFKTKDFAEKVGKIWEVRVPKISSSSAPEGYNLTLSVPQSFGSPSLISPNPKTQTASGGKIFLTFDKESLKDSGVSANFGTYQIFDFDLTYHIENPRLTPILTNIALPPDTSYQDVVFQRMEPKPVNVTIDDDGNYLAWYRLSRSQKLDIKVTGSAKLYTKSKVENPHLEESLKRKYTEAKKYWETDNPEILKKIEEIYAQSSDDPNGIVKSIYQFVVNYLKYDSERLNGSNVERLGALTVLRNPSAAVCMEFTDLFITLARAAGIPARELNGYAYTTNSILRPVSLNKDILHAWPEYWDDKRGWVMVDPTWENTTGGVDYFNKLDLNHFVFATKGFSSSEPVAAGSYKYQGQDTQDVKVSLSGVDFLGKPQINVSIENAGSILSGFPGTIKVKIANIGNAFFPSQTLKVLADKILVLEGEDQKLGPVPPYGVAEFKFNIRTKSLLDTFSDKIIVLIGDQKFEKDVEVKPFILFRTLPLMIGALISLMVLVYLAVLGGHYYRKRIKKAV